MFEVINDNPLINVEVSCDTAEVAIKLGEQTNVDVELQAFIKGDKGDDGSSANRLLYICNIRRASNFSGTISVLSTLVNTTGKTFTWSSGGGVIAILNCSDTNFNQNIINAQILMIDNTPNNPLPITLNGESMNFGVEPTLSEYRVILELTN